MLYASEALKWETKCKKGWEEEETVSEELNKQTPRATN